MGRRWDRLLAIISSLLIPLIWAIIILPLLGAGVPYLKDALMDPSIRSAITFSLEEAILASLIAVTLAIPLGYINATYEYPGRKIVEVVTLAPFTMPTISVALAFLLMVRTGLLAPGLLAISLANAYFNFGFCAQMISSSLLTVGKRIEEAADVLGASKWMKWKKIILPLSLRGVSYGFILTFTLSFASFAVPLLLGGPGSRTLEVEIYSLYKVFLDEGKASAAAILQLLVTFSLSLLMGRESKAARAMELRRRKNIPRSLLPALILPYALSLMALYPIGYLFLRSLVSPYTGKLDPLIYLAFLVPRYDPILGASTIRPLLNSLFFAFMTALTVLTISSLILLSDKARILARDLSILPLGTSSITLALGLFLFSSKLGIPGWIAMVMSHILIAFPFAIRSLESGVSGISPHLMDAAETLGASKLDAIFKVLLPAALPAVLSAAFYSLAISLSETSASTLLATPETLTLTVAALRYSGARRFQLAAAASSMVMVLTWIFLLVKSRIEVGLPWLRSE